MALGRRSRRLPAAGASAPAAVPPSVAGPEAVLAWRAAPQITMQGAKSGATEADFTSIIKAQEPRGGAG